MEVNGKTLAVEQQGSGEPLLMVHGLGGNTNTWQPQAATLQRFFKVTRFDLEGSGRSPLAGTLTIDGFVADLLALMDQLGIESCHLAGHSMGTIICMHAAVKHAARVKSLALLGPLAEPPEPARAAIRERAKKARSEGMAAVAEALLPVSLSAQTRAHRLAAASFVRESLMGQPPAAYAATCEALANATAAPLDRITCPCLLITGDEDGVGPPPATLRLASAIADARAVVLPGCGHWTPIEMPHEVNQALLNFYFA